MAKVRDFPIDGGPLGVVAVKRAGLRKAVKVFTFLAAWGVVCDELGKRPTVAAYSEFWKQHEVTTYRERSLWREVFPELDPTEFWFAHRDQVRERGTDAVPELMGLRAA